MSFSSWCEKRTAAMSNNNTSDVAMMSLYSWGQNNGAERQQQRTQRYYAEVFPAEALFDWVKAGDPNRLQEFALFTGEDVFERHFVPREAEELARALRRHGIDRLEIGPSVNNQGYPLTQRLAFDLDSDDYTMVYPGDGETIEADGLIAPGAWIMLVLSMGYLGLYLERVYGLRGERPFLFVFSGRRGAHLWVEGVERDWLNTDALKELADIYIPRLRTAAGTASFYKTIMSSSTPLPPKIQEWFDVIEEYGRAALCSDFLWARGDRTVSYLAQELSILLGSPITPSPEFFRNLDNDAMVPVRFWHTAGLLMVAPRPDKKVTTSKNHLLKSPFAMHPATRLVSLPFDPYESKNHVRDNLCISVDKLIEERDATNKTPSSSSGVLSPMYDEALELLIRSTAPLASAEEES